MQLANDKASANPTIHAVTDTNVFLDIYSQHDLLRAYDEARARLGSESLRNDQTIRYRISRARESLLLAIHFHKTKMTTYSLHSETVTLLTTRVPPARGGTSMESDFVTFFLYFVKDLLLTDWCPTMPTAPGTEAGNVADAALLKAAKDLSVPLITNEGHSPDGIADVKLRKLAKDAGVEVFTPREFYAGKLNEAEAASDFLARFEQGRPAFLARRRAEFGDGDKGYEVLDLLFRYYQHVFAYRPHQ